MESRETISSYLLEKTMFPSHTLSIIYKKERRNADQAENSSVTPPANKDCLVDVYGLTAEKSVEMNNQVRCNTQTETNCIKDTNVRIENIEHYKITKAPTGGNPCTEAKYLKQLVLKWKSKVLKIW